MSDFHNDVLLFHRKFDLPIGGRPCLPEPDRACFRLKLIREELNELHDAHMRNDLPQIADALVDLMYVIVGSAIEYGIDIRPLWEEVHKTNMRKEGTTEIGKVAKPPGWEPPAIGALLDDQPPLPYATRPD